METVACNLCGSDRLIPLYTMPDRRYPSDEWFTVVECSDCGLGFVNPRPTFEEMPKYYPPRYYQEEFLARNPRNLRRYARQARYLQEIERRNRGTDRPALLDLGCANGDFARFMQARGWRAEGVEVSASSAPIQDFKVYTRPFPEIPVDAPTCDAVTAWAVLEHVHDPMAYFQKAARVVKPGGLLVFLVTNFRSLASRHLFAEDVPRHLYFFTESTVRRYLQNVGFELIGARYGRDICEMPPANWLRYLVVTRLDRRAFKYEDLLPSQPDFLRQHGLQPGALSMVRFAWTHPSKVIDRVLWPAIERIEIMRGTYGICTYVAHKS